MILDDILKILKEKSNNRAYTINNENYSYKELYKYVCNLYNFLLENNKEKRPVVVYGHKEIYMKAVFLACSFAGMTYVPIDESLPNQRVEQIISQVNPDLIFGKNIPKEKIYDIISKENYNEITNIFLKPNDIYYIIFTSGSTGIPKGVKVTYSNLDSCINWLKSITNINEGVIINQANFSFDLSVADLYLSLITKSEHFILDNKNILDFNNIFEQLKKSNGNLIVATPSFIDLLLLDKSFGKELLPNLKEILFCGEKLLKSTVNKLYDRFDNLKIINSYGPTECTFAVTNFFINSPINDDDISIGSPKQDVKIYIVDENKNPVKDGNIGEILITGKSVSDGYLGNISKNNCFFDYNNEKAYLTGDLGYIKNGLLYYKDRKDNQIKFKGYRIELSDIENNLQELNYIDKAITTVNKNKSNKVLNIIAFVTLKENIIKTELEIKQDLQRKVPEYMCPKIKIIKNFPLNKNGKCDVKKLLEEI